MYVENALSASIEVFYEGKARKTGVVTNIENFHVHIFFLACALSGYIFVNPFTCVTDRYQHKQCIIMEIETETNMKIGCVCILLQYFC